MNTLSIHGARRAHQIGNRPEAVRLCREILRVNPKDFDALYLLGYLHSQAGELEEAERLIAEALKVNPYSSDAAYNRGCILQTLMRNTESSPWLATPGLVEIKAAVVAKRRISEFNLNFQVKRAEVKDAPKDAGKAQPPAKKG